MVWQGEHGEENSYSLDLCDRAVFGRCLIHVSYNVRGLRRQSRVLMYRGWNNCLVNTGFRVCVSLNPSCYRLGGSHRIEACLRESQVRVDFSCGLGRGNGLVDSSWDNSFEN